MVNMIRLQHIPVQIKRPTETFQCIILFKDHQHLPQALPQNIEADISMVYLQQLTEKNIGLHPALKNPHGVGSPSPAATDIGQY